MALQEFKPNIYPIMYWALLYGALSALGLFVVYLLASFITILWFPVFLAGLIWGGFRKYKQDKAAWMKDAGITSTPKSAVEEFKDAARDIADASREMAARHAQEDAQAAQQALEQESAAQAEQTQLANQDEIAIPGSEEAQFEEPATPPPSDEQEGIITQQPEEPKNPSL
jgi:FtsZ-interacting cell division protein ZipA